MGGLVVVGVVALGTATVDAGQLVQTYESNRTQENHSHAIEEMNHRAHKETEQLIATLSVINLDAVPMDREAEELVESFNDATEAIHRLEQAGGFEYGDVHRVAIQNAISIHMQRPGATQARISETIDAYSRYLTETLIRKTDMAAESGIH